LSCLALVACAAPGGASPDERPNVILFLADDVGVEAFSSYGGTSYETPHLDRLAQQGMLFTHCYSQPLCTPSRIKLMTGRGNLRNYVHFSILDPAERTFAHQAREAGYATAVAGKWQLYGTDRYEEWAGRGAGPEEAGFDRWCLWQLGVRGKRYWTPTVDVDGELHRKVEGAYGPDLFCDYLLDCVTDHRDEPFLAYFPMALVHDPFVSTPLSREGKLTKQECFADMMAMMDTIVGRIVARLDELGLRERTLVLFTSDNGTNRALTSRVGEREVRGGKGLSTDAGTHVPLIASWPGTVPAGEVCDDLVDFSDFLPTLVEAMGAELPSDRILDGRSFLPQLRGGRGNPRRHITIYSNPRPDKPGRNPRVRFARDKQFKLYDDGRLFDCEQDPLEESPLDEDELVGNAHSARTRLQQALDEMPPEPEHLRRVKKKAEAP
jgi:arylsulfatase A-like enzyme